MMLHDSGSLLLQLLLLVDGQTRFFFAGTAPHRVPLPTQPHLELRGISMHWQKC
jgi:hypothetical protein